jgi:hypothetical protein
MATLLDSYGSANWSVDQWLNNTKMYQSFTTPGSVYKLASCKFYCNRDGSDANQKIRAKLYSHSGTYGSSSVPNTLLATSSDVNISSVGVGASAWVTFTFDGTYSLSASTYYCIIIEVDSGSAALNTGEDNTSPSHGGNDGIWNGASWDTWSDDLIFEVYGDVSAINIDVPVTDVDVETYTPTLSSDVNITGVNCNIDIATPTPTYKINLGITSVNCNIAMSAPTPTLESDVNLTSVNCNIDVTTPTPTIGLGKTIQSVNCNIAMSALAPTITSDVNVTSVNCNIALGAPTPTVDVGDVHLYPPCININLKIGGIPFVSGLTTTSQFTVLINGAGLPSGIKIKAGTLNIHQGKAGEMSVLNFILIDMNTGGPPYIWNTLIGQKIEVYDHTGVLVWGGQLDEPKTRELNEHPVYAEAIQCVDWHFLASRCYVNQSYQKQLISETFKDIIDNFLAIDGIWYDAGSIHNTAGQYVSINCPYVKAADAFNEMAGLINWQWHIGPDKKFYLNDMTAEVGPVLTEHVTNYIPTSLKVSDNRSEYRNVQILRGVHGLTTLLNEKATPTPDQDNSFIVNFAVNQVPQLYITQDIDNPLPGEMIDPHQVGIGGIDSGLWFYWNKGSNIITRDNTTVGTPTIPAGWYLVVKYVGQYQIDIVEQDAAAIAARIAIEGGSGIYTNIEDGSYIEDVTVAQDKALAMLARYSVISTMIEVSTFSVKWEVGQLITVNIPTMNINDTFLITEKIIKDMGNLLHTTVSMVDGKPLGGWISYFSTWISPGKDWVIRPDAIVEVQISKSEKVEWHGDVTIKTFDCLYPANNLWPANNLYPSTLTSTVVEVD